VVGDLTSVNLESVMALHPQVVFVTNYAPQEMIDQISQAGIAVVAVSLRDDPKGEEHMMNPVLPDEDEAYTEGLKKGIALIGDVVNHQKQAQALIDYTFSQRQLTGERLKDIPANQRIRTYMANPDLTTYGSGKYTGLMMAHAGAMNVAAATVKGFKQVALEQVIAAHLDALFPGMDVLEHYAFRVTRDADYELSDDAEDVAVIGGAVSSTSFIMMRSYNQPSSWRRWRATASSSSRFG